MKTRCQRFHTDFVLFRVCGLTEEGSQLVFWLHLFKCADDCLFENGGNLAMVFYLTYYPSSPFRVLEVVFKVFIHIMRSQSIIPEIVFKF